MLDSDKLFAAVIIARALLENVGMLALSLEGLRTETASMKDGARELAITFLNHSYWKSREFKNPTAPDDIYVSPQASKQYGIKRPKVPQPGQMVAALDRYLKQTVPSLSTDLATTFYGPLSEWTHPSQSSITYGFTEFAIVPVPTSGGPIQHSSALRHSIAWCAAQIGVAAEIRDNVLTVVSGHASSQ